MNFALRTWSTAAAVLTLLAACGGGGDGSGGTLQPPTPRITAVKVMGDSLADSGTFGYKFTVQAAVPTGNGASLLWVDRVANQYSTTLCAAYRYNGSTFVAQTGCSNYAVGGAQINEVNAAASPLSILRQLQDAAVLGYTANDLVLVDGGGNDAAALVTAYLQASRDGGVAFYSLLGSVLDATTLQALQAKGAAGLPEAGGVYLQALAKRWAGDLQTLVLGKGASRLAVLNMPDVTLTPKLRNVLAAVAASQGTTVSQQLETLFSAWVQAFNQQLSASLAGDARVVVVDFAGELRKQISQPALYQYTNASQPACPAQGVDASGLPAYDLSVCLATTLSASIPAGENSTTWWQSYVFADHFHPTPYGHEQMARFVNAALTQAGWL